MLDRWIQMAETSGPVNETDDLAGAFNHQQLVERLIDLARTSPEELDPDVQIALGVLFNSSEVSTSPWELS
jgi:peroxin-5